MSSRSELYYQQVISGRESGLTAAALRAVLLGMTPFYAATMAIRNHCYSAGYRRITQLPVPVISIGNLTTGGTGKTPVTAFICSLLQREGYRPGIVSRGYQADASGTNDEKRVLDRLCPGVPHVQNSRRTTAAAVLLAENPAVNVLVLDDGFQHRRVSRCLDIVLIDACQPWGYDYLLPRGLLREPLSSLCRAQLVMVTRSDLVPEESLDQIQQRVLRSAPSLPWPVLYSSFIPSELMHTDGRRMPLDSIRHDPVFLMSGIGNPPAFEATCRSAGLDVRGHVRFPDHHHYTADELQMVGDQAQAHSCRHVITTLKDLVKLPPNARQFLALDISTKFQTPTQEFILRDCMIQSISRRPFSPPSSDAGTTVPST